MTSQPAEPTLADVQAQYPAWQCARGISGLFHAHQAATGLHVTGEDPLPGSPGALLHRGPLRTVRARSHAHGPSRPRGQFRCRVAVRGGWPAAGGSAAAAGRWRV